MSTNFRPFWPVFAVFGLILQFFTFGSGQDIEATIKIDEKNPSVAVVEGRFLKSDRPNRRNLAFLREVAGARGLGERISVRSLTDRAGREIQFKKLMAGEYLADNDIVGWKYEILLTPQGMPSSLAHVSWLDPDNGLLMLDDLLPQVGPVPAKLSFDIPDSWPVITTERLLSRGIFAVRDIEKAVFIIAKKDWRLMSQYHVQDHLIGLFVSGDWRFPTSDVGKMTGSIISGYSELFGVVPSFGSQIAIFRMPPNVPFDRWEAETRGSTVVIVSSDMPFETQSQQRLHEQLRHEMFHLWIPNGVNLSGNYDWFYEGFALYQSLKMGVASNRIRFDDLLDTLGRAITADRTHSNGISLIDTSKDRFGGSNSTVYARGMVVAFLCDLAMLDKSKGKRSVENLLREIYKKHHNSTVRTDGNDAVLAIFASYPELKPIVDRYIKAGDAIAADEYLRPAGIETNTQNSVTSLRVLPKPDSRQKDLLDKLGYNTWRKLANISK